MGWDFKNCLGQCKSSDKVIDLGYFPSGPISKTVPAPIIKKCQGSEKNQVNFHGVGSEN